MITSTSCIIDNWDYINSLFVITITCGAFLGFLVAYVAGVLNE